MESPYLKVQVSNNCHSIIIVNVIYGVTMGITKGGCVTYNYPFIKLLHADFVKSSAKFPYLE